MGKWLRTATVGSVVVSTGALLAVGAYYLLLQVDGGWYSYPGFAVSVGRDAYSQQLSTAAAAQLDGLKFVFQWDTTSSFRTLYLAPWFGLAGAGFMSVKMIGLIELSALALAAYAVYRSFFASRVLAFLALGVLVTDKTVLLMAVSDARPDVALAAMSCLLYALLRKSDPTVAGIGVICLVAIATSVTHVTSIFPFSFIVVATLVDAHFMKGQSGRTRRWIVLGVAATLAALAYVWRDPILATLLGSQMEVVQPVSSVQRVFESWAAGPMHLLRKETSRWAAYLGGANLALLVMYATALACFFKRGPDGLRIPVKLRGPIAGLIVAVIAVALFDPHPTAQHLVAITPFGVLLLAKFEHLGPPRANQILAGFVILASGMSAVAAYRHGTGSARNGISNIQMQDAMHRLFDDDQRSYVVAAPAELWPYMPKDRDILAFDGWRIPTEFEAGSGQALSEMDFVIVNYDMAGYGWADFLRRHAGSPGFRTVVDRPPYLTVFENMRHQDKGIQ